MSPTPVKSRHTNRGYRSVSGGHSHKVAARAPGANSVPHWGDGEWSGSSQADDGLYHPGKSHKSDDGQYHSNQDRTTDQDQMTQQQQQAQQQQAVAQQQQQSQSQQGQSSSGQSSSGQSGAYGQSGQGSQAGSSGQSSGSQGQSGSGQSGSYGASQQGSQAGSSGQYSGSQGQGSSGQSGSGQSGSSGQGQGSQAGSSGQYSGSQGQSGSGQSSSGQTGSGQSGSYSASQQGSQAGTSGQSSGSQGQSSSGQAGTSGQSSQQGSQAGSNSQTEQAQQAAAAQAQSQQQAAANANTQNVAPQANQQSQNGQSSNNAAANMAALTAAQQQQAEAEAAARNSQNNNNNGFHGNSLNDPSNVHNKPSSNMPNDMDDDDDLDDSDMSNVPHRHNHDHNYDPTSTNSLPSPSPTDGAAGHNPQSWHTATAVLSVFFALAVIGGLIAFWFWRKKKQQKKGLPSREKMQDSFQNGMSSTKKRASNLYASFLGTAAGTSAGALGAVRNSLRDPLPYLNRPTRHNSRIGFSDPIHEVSSSGSSSHSRHYDTSRSESVSDEKRHVNYSTPTLVVSPTEQQQQHPAHKAREQDTPTVRHVPSGRPELQRSNSLEARIGMATSPESEMDQAERAAENNPTANNSSANLTAPRPGQNLLAITSMVPSTTSIYRVEIGFTAKKVGQMDLREGQTVTIRQSFDDGWVRIYSPIIRLMK